MTSAALARPSSSLGVQRVLLRNACAVAWSQPRPGPHSRSCRRTRFSGCSGETEHPTPATLALLGLTPGRYVSDLFSPEWLTTMARMPESQVGAHIAYDGPAMKDRSMDVRDLAAALLALGDLLQGANRVVNGDKATLAVRVQADFTTGSFDIGLTLVQGVMSHLAGLLNL